MKSSGIITLHVNKTACKKSRFSDPLTVDQKNLTFSWLHLENHIKEESGNFEKHRENTVVDLELQNTSVVFLLNIICNQRGFFRSICGCN